MALKLLHITYSYTLWINVKLVSRVFIYLLYKSDIINIRTSLKLVLTWQPIKYDHIYRVFIARLSMYVFQILLCHFVSSFMQIRSQIFWFFLQNMQTLFINRTTFKLFTWMMGRWLNSVRTEDENIQKIVYRIRNTFHIYLDIHSTYIYIRLKSVDSRGHFLFIYLGTKYKSVNRLPKLRINCDLIRQKQKQISLNCALFFIPPTFIRSWNFHLDFR